MTDIKISELKEGIWYIRKGHASHLATKMNELPKGELLSAFVPYRDEVCRNTYKKIKKDLIDISVFEEFNKYISLYKIVEYMVDSFLAIKEKEEQDIHTKVAEAAFKG